jgi:sterol desaturase/sphingolipid hydroxylase (fatty acid hydroxylase superfamily)
MHTNLLLAIAVPFFIVFMLLEYLVARKKKLPYFNLHNSVANISIGIAERLLDVLVAGFFYFVYDYIQKNYGLFEIKASIAVWILLLLCTDLVWYWYHRLAHEINLFWAVHIVHHQSEDFNYTVSARITVLQAVLRTAFWSVLPFIGFPAHMITTMLLIHGLYPFFIHTQVIGKLGILEYILVTPSHHRVHHASNEKYLDKNYGDVFIIWDKLFGTFQKEEEQPVFGLTKPLKSYSFLWQHFHYFIELGFAIRAQKGFWNKVKIVFARPDAVDPTVRELAEQHFRVKKTDNVIDQPLNRYVVWQIAITVIVLFLFILFRDHVPAWNEFAGACFILLTLINCGAIMEQKRWVFYLEFARIIILLCSLVAMYPHGWLVVLLVAALLVAVYFADRLKDYYHEVVYKEIRRK